MKWNNLFMNVAKLYGDHSTCAKIKVGAVIVKNKRIISTGYNGVSSGHEHCIDIFKKRWEEEHSKEFKTFEDYRQSSIFLEEHAKFSDSNENHAEANAILFSKQDLTDCSVYVTYSPCTYCAKLIITSGIKKVYYKYVYGSGSGIETLTKNGVEVEKI